MLAQQKPPRKKGAVGRDIGRTFLNYAAMPAEIIAGKNFYDPRMETKGGRGIKRGQDVVSNFSAQALPAALNLIPGVGQVASMGLMAGRAGLNMADSQGRIKDFGQSNSTYQQTQKQNLAQNVSDSGYNYSQGLNNQTDQLVQGAGTLGQFAGTAANMAGMMGAFGQPIPKTMAYGGPLKYFGAGGFPEHYGMKLGSENPNFGNYPRFMMADGGMPKPTGPTYEAENSEVVSGKQPKVYGKGSIQKLAEGMFKIKGNTHENGGVKASGGQYVYSDRLTLDDSFLKGL